MDVIKQIISCINTLLPFDYIKRFISIQLGLLIN